MFENLQEKTSRRTQIIRGASTLASFAASAFMLGMAPKKPTEIIKPEEYTPLYKKLPEGVTAAIDDPVIRNNLYAQARRDFRPYTLYSLPDKKDPVTITVKNVITEIWNGLAYPGRMPGLRYIPPKPQVLLVDDNDTYIAQTYYGQSPDKRMAAFIIVCSMAGMDLLKNHNALPHTIGHELGHALIMMDPNIMYAIAGDMLQDRKLMDEVAKRKLEGEDLERFLKELICDRASVYATRSMLGLRANFEYAARMVDITKKEMINNLQKRAQQMAQRWVIQRESEKGQLTPQQRAELQRQFEAEIIQRLYDEGLKKPPKPEFPGGAYPSDDLRLHLNSKLRFQVAQKDGSLLFGKYVF